MENDTYDDVTRGLSAQPLSRFDNVFTPEMTEWLFPEGDANFGLDIAALNVQRGRDHQIPAYPSYKYVRLLFFLVILFGELDVSECISAFCSFFSGSSAALAPPPPGTR